MQDKTLECYLEKIALPKNLKKQVLLLLIAIELPAAVLFCHGLYVLGCSSMMKHHSHIMIFLVTRFPFG